MALTGNAAADIVDEPLVMADHQELTEHLLALWSSGDEQALSQLVPRVYRELRRIADRSLMRERRDHTLEPTALVHEAYLRMLSQHRTRWRNRSQFMGVAAELMRRVLVDHARRRRATKRDGGHRVVLDERVQLGLRHGREDQVIDLIALDDALNQLQVLDPRQARIVELRYFAGLKIEEAAEVLRVSPRTVKREWTLARAWLKRQISRSATA